MPKRRRSEVSPDPRQKQKVVHHESSPLLSSKREDLISKLHDEILILILSFLSLKDAVVTSALSTRWKHLWAARPRLDFNFNLCYLPLLARKGRKSFDFTTVRNIINEGRPNRVEWVDKAIALHQQQQQGRILDEFAVSLGLDADYSNAVDGWLMFALSNPIQTLKLDFNNASGRAFASVDRCYTFPAKLAACLTSPSSRCSLQPCGSSTTSLLGLKSLKSLCLKSVNIDGEDVLEGLVSACPLLESMALHNVGLLKKLQLSLPSSRLKHLEIWGCDRLQWVGILGAPLVSLKWKFVVRCYLRQLPHLVELAVTVAHTWIERIEPFSPFFSQLKRLRIKTNCVESYEEMKAVSGLTNLEELEIVAGFNNYWEILRYTDLIEEAPCLRKLVMTLEVGHLLKGSDTVSEVKKLPCKHLKALEFHGYHGYGDDDAFIWYFIENAISLETVVISIGEYDLVGRGRRRRLARKNFEGKVPPRIKLVIA